MQHEEIRRQVLAAIRQAAALGLVRSTSGNIAVRDFADNVIAITPSGRPYDAMEPADIAVVDLDGRQLDGAWRPSSETPMHLAVYRARPDVGATVHLHGLFCTVMAMTGEELPVSTPPQAEFAPIRTVPFAPPGSGELARLTAETLGGNTSVLLKNHGSFHCGRDISSAMAAAIYTEEAAQTAYYATLLGNFHPLGPAEIAAVKETLAAGRAV